MFFKYFSFLLMFINEWREETRHHISLPFIFMNIDKGKGRGAKKWDEKLFIAWDASSYHFTIISHQSKLKEM